MFGPNHLSMPSSVTAFQKAWDGQTPFAIATVVHTIGATAAKAGTRAVITAAGEIIGFVGGGCVRNAILDTAAAVLDDGEPRFITTKPRNATPDTTIADGELIYPSSCPSRGEMKFFIEAVLPQPPLLVIGETDIAWWVMQLAVSAGLQPRAAAIEISSRFDVAMPLENVMSLEGLDNGFIVVATQGVADLKALRMALGSPCQHVLFVASPQKVEHIRKKLVSDPALTGGAGDLSRLVSPAGLDLGGQESGEIAISIIAQIISLRHQTMNHDVVPAAQ